VTGRPGEPNYCSGAGHLVGGERRLPADPSEYYTGGLVTVIGCNHVMCTRCGAVVRQESGVIPYVDGIDSLETVYDLDDWSPALRASAESVEVSRFRFYACRCTAHCEGDFRALDAADDYDPWLPWECAGHPLAELPLEIDGRTVGEDTDVRALVRATLAGDVPEGAHPREHEFAHGWVAKLYVRLRGHELAEDVAEAAAACLDDPDPHVRGAALLFSIAFPEARGADRVLDLAADQRDLFAGVPDPTAPAGWTLERRLLQAVARHAVVMADADDERAASAWDLVRRAVREGAPCQEVLPVVASRDAAWLVDHAVEAVRACPDLWEEVLDALGAICGRDGGPFGEAGERLARAGVVDPDVLRRYATDYASDEARTRMLTALDPR